MDFGSRIFSFGGKYMPDGGSAHCGLVAVVSGPLVEVWGAALLIKVVLGNQDLVELGN